MRFFKWLFSSKSKSKKVVPEILLLSILVAITTVIAIVSNVIEIKNTIDRILGIIVLLLWIVFAIPCALRIYDISCYRKKKQNGEKPQEFKHTPVQYAVEDVLNWIKNANIPDTIYVKGIKDNSVSTISVDFEVIGKNGPFLNKEIIINENIVEEYENITDILSNVCTIEDDKITILAITENNDPKLFEKMNK